MNRMFPTSGRLIRKSNECTFGSCFVHSRCPVAARRHRVGIRIHPTVSQGSPKVFYRLLRSHLTKSGGATYSLPIYHHIHSSRPGPSPKTRCIVSKPVRYPRPRATFPLLKPCSDLHIIPWRPTCPHSHSFYCFRFLRFTIPRLLF